MSHSSTAVVTGAGSRNGLGRAIVLALAKQGYVTAIVDIDEDSAVEAADWAERMTGSPSLGLGADVSKPGPLTEAFDRIDSELPPVSVLVNNAGISAPTRFDDITLEEWNRIFDVNVVGTVLPTQRVLPGMKERGFGRIINISSISAQRGGGVFGGTHYSASKAAILGLTKALARECGSSGVTVNSVAPGMVDTNITDGKMSEERKRQLAADALLGRLALPNDVANAVVFLVTPDSSYITGATIDVNGGAHLH